MTCRKPIRRCRNRGVPLPPGLARENPEAYPSGIRHVGGAKLNQAFTGPMSFGSGGPTNPSSGSGDLVGIVGNPSPTGSPELYVPTGYISGTALSDMSSWNNKTFMTLGAVPGTYVWMWGSGATADSFTLDIIAPAAVPEPSSLALLTLPLGLVMWLAGRHRRAT